MANQNINKEKAVTKEVIVDKEKPKGKKYLIREDLGWEKRNFHTGTEKVQLVAGEEVDEKTYNLFSSYCKEVFFKK